MDPAPQRDPEPTPDAASDSSAKSSPQPGAAAGATNRGPSEAYTTMPDFKKPKKARWPAALATALAVAAVGFGLTRAHRAPPAAPGTSQQIIVFSQKDFDQKATKAARALLADKKAPAPEKVAGPSPTQQAAFELAKAPQPLRDEIASGRAGFYTFQLAALSDEGGDVYDIAVDGVPILQVTTSPELKSITIPVDATKPHTVTETLVFARPRTVYAKNGTAGPPPEEPKGQASLTIQTSEGEAASHLSAGQSESWTTQFHGSGGGP